MTQFFAKKLNKKGFTLAELLIVVAIIAVLVAIAIPIYTGALEKARYGVHYSNARTLKSMGAAAILADKGLESHADVEAWEVTGTYNFTTQTFAISDISEDDGNKDAPLMQVTYTSADSSVASDLPLIFHGAGDEKIGKIATSGQAGYQVTVTAQDITSQTVNYDS